jgi:hypothetical protein
MHTTGPYVSWSSAQTLPDTALAHPFLHRRRQVPGGSCLLPCRRPFGRKKLDGQTNCALVDGTQRSHSIGGGVEVACAKMTKGFEARSLRHSRASLRERKLHKEFT